MTGDQSRGSLHDAIIGRRLKSVSYVFYALAGCVWAYGGWVIDNANQGGSFSFGEWGFLLVAFGALGFWAYFSRSRVSNILQDLNLQT